MSTPSFPNSIRTALAKHNLPFSIPAFIYGLSFPLVGYSIMHPVLGIGGQGASSQHGLMAWTARAVAIACVVCSSPKVFDRLSSMFGASRNKAGDFLWTAKRYEALGATVAMEAGIIGLEDPVIPLVFLALSAALNGISVACTIVADHKVVLEAAREERKATDSMGILERMAENVPAKTPRRLKAARKPRPTTSRTPRVAKRTTAKLEAV